MGYTIIATPVFRRELKRLVKKFPSLRAEYAQLIDRLEEHPDEGTLLGNNCYKIRMAIASKGKGKSGGARIITNIAIADTTVYLLTIYDKSEHADISDKDLKELLKQIT